MKNPSPHHFSIKLFFVSLLLAALSAFLVSLYVLKDDEQVYRAVTPTIYFDDGATVEMQSAYDSNFLPVTSGQVLLENSKIKTAEDSVAELRLENNVIRLNESTEVRVLRYQLSERKAYNETDPRLSLDLIRGSVWVSAFDQVRVDVPSAQYDFSHSVGAVYYTPPLNRGLAFNGAADIQLLDQAGQFAGSFVLPLNNQITYADGQITQDYLSLKDSKLKKELKANLISQEILQEPWLLENNLQSISYIPTRLKLVELPLFYWAKKTQLNVFSLLAIRQEAEMQWNQDRFELIMGYVFGNIDSDQISGKIASLPDELQLLMDHGSLDENIHALLVDVFLSVSHAKSESAQGQMKESLFAYFVEREGPVILRVHLRDLYNEMGSFRVGSAERLALNWSDQWDSLLNEATLGEFTRQSEEMKQIFLTYPDRLTSTLLNVFDQTGQRRLSMQGDSEEVRFGVVEDRLTIAASLTNAFRYVLARQYLTDSYLGLNIDFLPQDLASTQIFLKSGEFLARRIQYAEDRLRFAAVPIDDSDFKTYLETEERNEGLKELLAIEESELFAAAPAVALPTPLELVQQMSQAGITVLISDISVDSGNPNEYLIANAQVGQGAQRTSFKASFSPIASAFRNVEIDGDLLSGSFTLRDFATILPEVIASEASFSASDSEIDVVLPEILGGDSTQDERDQIIIQNLALQLTYNELNAQGISIVSVSDIELLDRLSLDRFKIMSATISLPDQSKNEVIDFNYNSSTKQLSNVIVSGSGDLLIDQVNLGEFDEVSADYLSDLIRLDDAIKAFQEVARANDFLFDISDFSLDADGNLLGLFLHEVWPELVIEISFDPQSKTFLFFKNDLYQAFNVEFDAYMRNLLEIVGEDFLIRNDLPVPASIRWFVSDDYDRLTIEDYNVGTNSFNFTIDLQTSELLNVFAQEDDSRIPRLSIEAFKEVLDRSSGPRVPSG